MGYVEFLDLVLEEETGVRVFFQPEQSFDYCGARPLSVVKHEIRARFRSAAMPYNGEQIDRRLEALLYMFPMDPFGRTVRWWEPDPGDPPPASLHCLATMTRGPSRSTGRTALSYAR